MFYFYLFLKEVKRKTEGAVFKLGGKLQNDIN